MGNAKCINLIMVLAVVLAAVVFAAAPTAAQGEIGIVNIQEVFEAHPDKTDAEAQLNLEAQEMQAELEEQADDLSQEEQQNLLNEYREELTAREQELIQGVLAEIEQLVNQLAEEKGLSIVIDSQSVVYGGYDLTPELIEMIN
ncbi:MAG: OmpH family outer membrane protein [Bacillota bacterium]